MINTLKRNRVFSHPNFVNTFFQVMMPEKGLRTPIFQFFRFPGTRNRHFFSDINNLRKTLTDNTFVNFYS